MPCSSFRLDRPAAPGRRTADQRPSHKLHFILHGAATMEAKHYGSVSKRADVRHAQALRRTAPAVTRFVPRWVHGYLQHMTTGDTTTFLFRGRVRGLTAAGGADCQCFRVSHLLVGLCSPPTKAAARGSVYPPNPHKRLGFHPAAFTRLAAIRQPTPQDTFRTRACWPALV